MEKPPTTQLITKPKQLTVADLESLPIPVKVQNGFLILERSSCGHKLKQPTRVSLNSVLSTGEKGLVSYVLKAFSSERPCLIPFVFENKTLIQLSKHFLRHCSGSPHSVYSYVNTIHRYSSHLGYSPDLIIQDVKPVGAVPDPLRIQNHKGFLEDYIAALQDEGLSPGRVHCYAKHIRTFYRVNGVKIELSEPLSRRVVFKDRAPKPEELACILEIADLRERVIVSMLALGGFREETLSKLRYRHVKEDLEANKTPIHIHVEAEITKGKYSDYDTFLDQEAATYLKLYLQQRIQGSPDGRNAPESITDESPLFRDETKRTPRGISSKQVRKIVHNLYAKAGLLKVKRGRMYDLRVHSLRKFFKTQLLALGVQPDYVDYMMGHVIDIYHDIEMKGIDFLRGVYSASGLSIRPKTKTNKIETIKEMIRAMGLNPEQVLTREALNQPARTYVNLEERQNNELAILSTTLHELIRQDAVIAIQTEQIRTKDNGPAGN